MAVRELDINTNVALVARISSCEDCSHRVGAKVRETHKHFGKSGVGVKVGGTGVG